MPDVSFAGARAGETVLLVEDDDSVRAYSASALAELGYVVLEACDGESARTLLDGQDKIDLLLTDVVLTGSLTGRDVAEHCRAARPGTPVLFTSGYAREALMHNDRLDADVTLLSKPFTLAQLAKRARAALDGGGRRTSGSADVRG